MPKAIRRLCSECRSSDLHPAIWKISES